METGQRCLFTHHHYYPLSSNSTTTSFPPYSHHYYFKIPSHYYYIRFFIKNKNNTTSSSSRRRRSRQWWDSNAETVRTPRFNFFHDDDDDEEIDDDFPSMIDQEGSAGLLLDEIIDNVYIFKVFRSFGWMLPAIILSTLLATGLKAFLLALAIPLGQSALSVAFDTLVGQTQKSIKRKRMKKKKPFGSPRSGVKMGKDQEASKQVRKEKMGYQSWVPRNAGSVRSPSQDAPSFSGWDDLENRRDYNVGSMRKTARTTSGSRRIQTAEDKLTGREKRSNTPLLLRLLIVVFPFLGS